MRQKTFFAGRWSLVGSLVWQVDYQDAMRAINEALQDGTITIHELASMAWMHGCQLRFSLVDNDKKEPK